MKSFRENPDGPENQEATNQNEREVFALNMQERIAQLTAHRVCGNQEHDAQNGKICGYCVVCQVPWPCDIAKERS